MWNWVAGCCEELGQCEDYNRQAVQLAKILIATCRSWHLWIWTSVPLSRKFVDSSIRGARPRALQGGVRPPAAGGRHPRLLHHDGHPDIRCRQAHIISILFMKYLDLLILLLSAPRAWGGGGAWLHPKPALLTPVRDINELQNTSR